MMMMMMMIRTVLMTLMVTMVVVVVLSVAVVVVVVLKMMTMRVVHDGLPLSIAMWQQGIATPIHPTRRNPTAQRHDRCIGGTHPSSALHPPPMRRHQITPRQVQATTTTRTMTTKRKGWDTIGRLGRCLPSSVQPTKVVVVVVLVVVAVVDSTAAAAAAVVLVAAFERAD
jgi:hypothetical protein